VHESNSRRPASGCFPAESIVPRLSHSYGLFLSFKWGGDREPWVSYVLSLWGECPAMRSEHQRLLGEARSLLPSLSHPGNCSGELQPCTFPDAQR
jgi:hypothetical protein